MKISKHAMERYLERYKDISVKELIAQKIRLEEDQLKKELESIFEKSRLVYTGPVGDGNDTKSFYLYREDNSFYTLVYDKPSDTIVTFYEIIIKGPKNVHEAFVNGMLEGIDELLIKIEENEENFKEKKEQSQESIRLLENKKEQLLVSIQTVEEEMKFEKSKVELERQKIIEQKSTLLEWVNELFGYSSKKVTK